MPSCSRCPGRSFKDDNGLQMHMQSGKHTAFTCRKCGKVKHSQISLEQHARVQGCFFECEYCDREFITDEGRLAHQMAEHRPKFECRYCDREFTTDQARGAHEKAKHPMFECHYCDREFKSEEAREQHERDKHSPGFECRHCDREFSSEKAREQHEDAKHPTFECHYCDLKFFSEDARELHENATHLTFECHHCDRDFSSVTARQQHENAKHHFECKLCGESFTRVEALQQHERTTPHIECDYCTMEFLTQASKNAHGKSCSCNPANRITHSNHPSLRPGSLSSNAPKSTGNVDEESSTSDECTDEGSESPAPPSHPSDSTSDNGELYHSTSGIPSRDASGEGTIAEQPVLDDTGTVDNKHQDGSADPRSVIFQCIPCLRVFETEEVFRKHVCASGAAMFRPHCTVCYTQFDDEPSLQKHLEGLQAFSCHLCPTRCCSDEMLQDHLLDHPTCSKCGKSFADNLALCLHVGSDHPVVVCWDCDGIVVEKDSLELHYADSPAHPSCVFCGLGKRNSADMDEHIRHVHASSAEMEGDAARGNMNAIPDEDESPSAGKQPPGADREEGARQPLEEPDHTPPVSVGGPGDEPHNGSLQTDSSLFLSPNEAAITGGEEPPDVDLRQHASPSPTPSEHGSNASRLQPVASEAIDVAMNNNSRTPSPTSSVSAEPFSDTSTQNSSTSSSQSVVLVSADGIPDYIRENRAMLVATSAGSPSSGHTPLRLSSSSSLESLEMVDPLGTRGERAPTLDDATATGTGTSTNLAHRLHCRICLSDPCEDMTATICGHLFCKRCITQAVVAKSECPVCKSATLLYCLFKLDLSV